MKLIYILSKDGKPLMPTKRKSAVRKWLKNNEAKIVSHRPFTIQFLKETEINTQPINLGIDAGYAHIGVSALNTEHNEEVYSEVVNLRTNEVKKNEARYMYRRTRRSRLRHRKPRFNNRSKFTKSDGFAPSIYHKMQEHVKAVDRVKAFLPIANVIVEVGKFDTQMTKAKAKGEAVKRRNGEMQGEKDLKAYVFKRDHFTCQVCTQQKPASQLHCHHIIYRSKGGTNQPANLLTVCTGCHTPANHLPGGALHKLMTEASQPFFKGGFFMSALNKWLPKHLEFTRTDGFETTYRRDEVLGWGKEHFIDALVIAGADKDTERLNVTVERTKLRINNRSLSKFYDAKWLDGRDKEVRPGRELFNGRTTRDKTRNSEDLHKHRAQKIKPGRVQIRRQHYQIRPYDVLDVGISKGIKSYGTRVVLDTGRSISVKKVMVLRHTNGYRLDMTKLSNPAKVRVLNTLDRTQ